MYTRDVSGTAKVFQSGNSQAVRLPRELRFAEGVQELDVRRDGDRLILSPRRPRAFSAAFWSALGQWPTFERPPQTRQKRKRIFP